MVLPQASPLPRIQRPLATIRIHAARDTPRALAAASTRFKSSGGKRIIAASLVVFPGWARAASRDEALDLRLMALRLPCDSHVVSLRSRIDGAHEGLHFLDGLRILWVMSVTPRRQTSSISDGDEVRFIVSNGARDVIPMRRPNARQTRCRQIVARTR